MSSGEKLIYPGGSSTENNGLGFSCLGILTNDAAIGVDFGLEFLNGGRYAWPDKKNFCGRKLTHLLLTHAHTDHVGALVQGEEAGIFEESMPIFGSPQTQKITPIVLDQTWNHIGTDYYSIVRIVERQKELPLGEFELTPGIMMFSHPAGHLPGAAYYIVRLPSGLKVLCTGDMAKQNQEVVLGHNIPDDIPDEWLPDVIAMTDLTNPSLTPLDYDLVMGNLAEYVRQKLDQTKIIVAATFMTGREQNVGLGLRNRGISPVYADGGGVRVYKIFNENPWSPNDREFSLDGIRFVESREEREKLLKAGGPLVITTPSGMGDGGPIRFWLDAGLEREDFEFISTSWVVPGCTMHKLLEKSKRLNTSIALENDQTGETKKYKINAKVSQYHIGGHGGLGDFIIVLRKLVERREKLFGQDRKKLQLIAMTHGTQETKTLAAPLLSEFAESVIPANIGTVVEL